VSLRAYPEYKDSGVVWLGHVPRHWKLLPLNRVTMSKCDGPFGSGLKSEHYCDEGVRVVRLQNIRKAKFDGGDAVFIAPDYFERELAGHGVEPGDLLVAGLGDDRNTVGRACVAPPGLGPAMVKADCFRFRLDGSKVVSSFIAHYLTAGAVADAGLLSSGSTRSRIPLSIMATRTLTLPPIGEQAEIMVFLDRETGKIDTLVAEQERLIALLQEKRQAAITKGLTPGVPMKPSGISSPSRELRPSATAWGNHQNILQTGSNFFGQQTSKAALYR
jgi:type I restriction enzyme, S subunit